MALGTFAYILLNLAVGRAGQISGIVWGLGVVFIAFFVVTTTLM